MSYKVKPEDVPDTLAIELQDNLSGVTIHAYRSNISKILNAAIEAGLVSPPCWIARATSGQLISGTVYPSKEDAEHYKWSSDNVEHWKGQTS